MSKESRRAARLARESRRAAGAGASRPTTPGGASGQGASGGGSADGGPSSLTGGSRRPGASTAPARAGRRERVRPHRQASFLERYRTLIVTVVGVAVVAIAVGWVFLGATAPAYACTNIFDPSPTPTVSPGSSTRLGFVEEDMGRSHIVSVPQQYLYCPPASGTHYNQTGLGPIQPRVYPPDSKMGPQNWVHNLEHGAIVVLYRHDSPGATTAGQQAFKTFYDTFPASPICKIPPRTLSPVIAPFDQMPHMYAALVWDRVLYFDTWDPDLVLRFYNTEAERLDANGALVAPIEDVSQCAQRIASSAPSIEPSGSVAPAPSGSAAPSAAGSPAASTEPSPAAS